MEPPYPYRTSVRHFVPGFLGSSVRLCHCPTLVTPPESGESLQCHCSGGLNDAQSGQSEAFLICFQTRIHMFQCELGSQFSPDTSQWTWLWSVPADWLKTPRWPGVGKTCLSLECSALCLPSLRSSCFYFNFTVPSTWVLCNVLLSQDSLLLLLLKYNGTDVWFCCVLIHF